MTARILIVDDETALLRAISDYLSCCGFECECASEVAEAIALLAHMPFDIVLTDVYLSHVPQADGFSVVSFIRERALPIRVIVMTAHDTPQLQSEAERLHADLFLLKPIALPRLVDALVAFTRDDSAGGVAH
jgi:DNA-binding NtrC family response regulator